MDNNIILSSISLNELENMLEKVATKVFSSRLTAKEEEEELLTRQEAAKFLNISLPTLHKITQAGLPFHRVGNKIRYKKGDLREHTKQKYN